MFLFVEVECTAKILDLGKAVVVVSINLLYLEQCIVRSDTMSDNPTGCLHSLILYASYAAVCNNKKKAGII